MNMAMFEPGCLSTLQSLPPETALEDFKSCFMQLIVQLGEVGDDNASRAYMDWLKGSCCDSATTTENESDLTKAINSSKNLLEMHQESIESIAQDVKTLLVQNASTAPAAAAAVADDAEDEAVTEKVIQYNEFIRADPADSSRIDGLHAPYRCQDCGSSKVAPRALISHSASVESMIQLFTLILPDLSGMKVVDIGSGLGSLLYGAHYFSNSDCICGIDLNKEFCDIVSIILEKYNLSSRVSIVNADILDQGALVQAADVVMFNNVLEYFAAEEVQKKIWEFLRQSIKPGTIFVTNPDLQTLLKPLSLDSTINEWVDPLETHVDKSVIRGFPETDEIFFAYRIKSQS